MTNDIQPAQYTRKEVETILRYKARTIADLVHEGILIQHGRGQNARYNARAVAALLEHLEAGGDLWQAPKMRSQKPVAVAPMATAQHGKITKASGGRRSASAKAHDPIKFVLNRNKTLKES